jgi:hypothetical protein
VNYRASYGNGLRRQNRTGGNAIAGYERAIRTIVRRLIVAGADLSFQSRLEHRWATGRSGLENKRIFCPSAE